MRKKEGLTLKVLELIGGAILNTAEVIEAMLSSPYGASYSQIGKTLGEIRQRRHSTQSEQNYNRRQLDNILYRLKRDNLIEQKTHEGRRVWTTTKKGLSWLKIFKNKKNEYDSLKSYKKIADDEFKIIAFDVPEKHRKKRRWLRIALTHLGFTMLQKSIWIGKTKLPKDFIEDLGRLRLLPYVEILAVTKTGSLKQFSDSAG